MKKEGLCKKIKNVVTFDKVIPAEKEELMVLGINLISFAEVADNGSK